MLLCTPEGVSLLALRIVFTHLRSSAGPLPKVRVSGFWEDSIHYSQNRISSKRYFSGVVPPESSEVPLKQ
ncbi:MAG: hypothetical protein DMG96_25970 [Acidobacteria bacterium]|nr:MAG: hypothetical protein DMG98_14295 [Acidobacteriota bacterium]PYV72451.1 MAG: hypothetical protein DMG96_25970 [Acidobacteriota bacterium]